MRKEFIERKINDLKWDVTYHKLKLSEAKISLRVYQKELNNLDNEN